MDDTGWYIWFLELPYIHFMSTLCNSSHQHDKNGTFNPAKNIREATFFDDIELRNTKVTLKVLLSWHNTTEKQSIITHRPAGIRTRSCLISLACLSKLGQSKQVVRQQEENGAGGADSRGNRYPSAITGISPWQYTEPSKNNTPAVDYLRCNLSECVCVCAFDCACVCACICAGSSKVNESLIMFVWVCPYGFGRTELMQVCLSNPLSSG